jgi:hypothetical protein
MLTIEGSTIPGGHVSIWYIEAYCRPGSTDRDWNETVIPHKSELLESAPDATRLALRHTLADGVIVDHEIRASADSVTFRVTAKNPTDRPSAVHWAQPCIRVDRFVGVKAEHNGEAYLPRCFIFLEPTKPARFPTQPWATKARYTPGQVYRPAHVPADDVNPRPVSTLRPANGLIGGYSHDESMILATAWEPYQELFQGVITCLHSDFRIGGLAPGETKHARGVLYILPAKDNALLERYRRDFPEQIVKP